MTMSWDDFYAELHQEAARQGSVEELAAWEQHFRNELSLIHMRRAAGMSQRQLAARARVEQAEISRIEQGKGNPTLRTLLRLVAACGARLSIELPSPPVPKVGRTATNRAVARPSAATATRASRRPAKATRSRRVTALTKDARSPRGATAKPPAKKHAKRV